MGEITQSINKRIPINTDLDIIVARLRAREVARAMGFGTIDQARISLAAGELARVLAKSVNQTGEILISGINTQGHLGIQVISVSPCHDRPISQPVPHEAQDQTFSDVLALVDEGFVEPEGDQGTRVTLMKWLS